MVAPLAYGSFQARDQIQATVETYTLAEAMTDPWIQCTMTRDQTCAASLLTHCATAGTPKNILN